jgi:exonuclease III
MRIATYNVNGINGRLANLLGWLEEAAPDIVCLQELKAPDDKFPAATLRKRNSCECLRRFAVRCSPKASYDNSLLSQSRQWLP